MRKRAKRTSFILSFLDVLSNALAAVFILAMVKLQPDVPGTFTGGLYYIQVDREIPSLADSSLMLATKFGGIDEFAHEPEEYLLRDTRLIITSSYAKQIFLKEPKLNEFEDVFCYLQDPDFSRKGACISVQIKLPNIDVKKTIWLDENNEFRTHFIQNGRIQNEAFTDCLPITDPI
ncbi:MAG: hypothetical protein MI974_29960 [Chitinophagales bacterium]|nr:hypothetical protein [Chitinophagales bacterium]